MAISCRFCPGEPDPPQGYARAPAARMYTAPRAHPSHDRQHQPQPATPSRRAPAASSHCMPTHQHHQPPPDQRARRARPREPPPARQATRTRRYSAAPERTRGRRRRAAGPAGPAPLPNTQTHATGHDRASRTASQHHAPEQQHRSTAQEAAGRHQDRQ